MTTRVSPRRTLRLGIVGAGGIMRSRHLPALMILRDVQIVAVANARPKTAEAVASDFGIPEVLESWAEMTDRTDLDVFCQARMAMTLNEGRAMLAAAKARPELVSRRCPPKVGMRGGRYFNKLMGDGYAGELVHFDLRVHSDLFVDARAPAQWRQRTEICGINALSLGVYAEILNGWFGLPLHLQASMKVAVPVRCGYWVQVPDVVQVIGEWSDGLLGILEWSAVAHFPPDSILRVDGRDGTLTYNFTTDQIFGARRGDIGLNELPIPSEYDTPWTVEADFINAVRRGESSAASFGVGVQYLEFTEGSNSKRTARTSCANAFALAIPSHGGALCAGEIDCIG